MQYRPGVRLWQYMTRQKYKPIVKTIDYARVEEEYRLKRAHAVSIEQELQTFDAPREKLVELQQELSILWIQMRTYEKILKIAPDQKWVKGTSLKQSVTEESTIIL